jgi:hypothetical protein
MRTHIDFSVITVNGDAIGHIEGDINFSILPEIGDTICLMLAPKGSAIPSGHLAGGMLRVKDRIIWPEGTNMHVSLSLEDLVADTTEQAVRLMKYFDAEFGLIAVSNLLEEL